MVRHPQAFLMDEPLSNLDAKLRVHARAEIADLHRRLGATFIYVTHDQAEAMTMSDRVAVMMGGRLLQVAPPQEIYDQPATLEVARFVGTPEINVLPGRVRGDGALEMFGRAWPVEVDAEAGSAVQVAIRPEAFALDAADQRGRTPPLAGAICNIERLGSETLVHVGDRPACRSADRACRSGQRGSAVVAAKRGADGVRPGRVGVRCRRASALRDAMPSRCGSPRWPMASAMASVAATAPAGFAAPPKRRTRAAALPELLAAWTLAGPGHRGDVVAAARPGTCGDRAVA